MISTGDAFRPTSAVGDGLLRPGRQVFRRYQLRRIVGRGGMGVVWLAHDEKLDRPLALKFLPEVFFLDSAARDDLKRETRRSLDLTHPHIVRIHDFVEDEEMAAIAMEYVDGPTLSELRVGQASRYFEPSGLEVWTAGLCAALDYAHDAGRCVHRDLKPGNLMVNARGVLKVADFGISCSLNNTAARVSAWTSTGGTLGYMSPQQLLGELAAPSDDIYSVGATLYELLTGKPPFHSGDIAVQIREVVPESVTERRRKFGLPGTALPKAWEETIAACLAKRPGDRPASAGEVARRLGLVCAPAAESAPALGDSFAPTICSIPAEVMPRPGRGLTAEDFLRWGAPLVRHRWPLITAFALLAAIVPWFAGSHVVEAPHAVPTPPADLPVPNTLPAVVALPAPPRATPVEVVANPPVAVMNGDQQALTAPIPIAVAVPVAVAAPQVQIQTVPAGIAFKIFAGAYETSIAEVVRAGETPATLTDLAPGAYRVLFTPTSGAIRSASMQVPNEGATVFQQEFPHGTLKLRSQPDGAEVVCDGREIGQTPIDLAVLPGRHELVARAGGRESRPRVAQVADAAEQTLAFDFRTSSTSGKTPARRPKKVEDDSMLTKVGRTLKTMFGGDQKKR